MSLPVVLRPEARADILETRDWYERQRSALGTTFLEALDRILARIGTMPELYGEVGRGVRRGKLGRFPYVVYYRVLPDRVEVLALLHGSRDPKRWQDRA